MPRNSPADRTDITDETNIVADASPTSADMPGETVILHPATGRYYGLEGVGTRVWELVQKPRTFGEICAILGSEYDVDPSRLAGDLRALLEELAATGLVTVGDAADR